MQLIIKMTVLLYCRAHTFEGWQYHTYADNVSSQSNIWLTSVAYLAGSSQARIDTLGFCLQGSTSNIESWDFPTHLSSQGSACDSKSTLYAVRQYFCRQPHGSCYDNLADFGMFWESKRRDQESLHDLLHHLPVQRTRGAIFSLSFVIVWQNTYAFMQSWWLAVLATPDSSVKLISSGSQQQCCPVCPTMLCSHSCRYLLSLLKQCVFNHFCSMHKFACCTETQLRFSLAMLSANVDTLA